MRAGSTPARWRTFAQILVVVLTLSGAFGAIFGDWLIRWLDDEAKLRRPCPVVKVEDAPLEDVLRAIVNAPEGPAVVRVCRAALNRHVAFIDEGGSSIRDALTDLAAKSQTEFSANPGAHDVSALPTLRCPGDRQPLLDITRSSR